MFCLNQACLHNNKNNGGDDYDNLHHTGNDDSGDDSNTNEPEGVTAESYGRVAAGNAEQQVWLLRIPPKLAQAFAAAPEGTVLGDLVFTKGGVVGKDGKNPTKPTFTVHVSDELSELDAAVNDSKTGHTGSNNNDKNNITNNLPLHYSLQSMTKKVPVLHPFVRHDTNGSTTVWGTVSRTANVQVEQDARYRALIKDRLVATNITSQRYVRPMENTESVTSRTAAASLASSKASFGDAVYQFGKRRLEALEQQKDSKAADAARAATKARQFAPDQNLRSVLFELFQQQPYWTVKDLKAAAVAGGATHAGTSKAETKMRDILKTIGEYHRSGDHKTMWSLRKEYQQG